MSERVVRRKREERGKRQGERERKMTQFAVLIMNKV